MTDSPQEQEGRMVEPSSTEIDSDQVSDSSNAEVLSDNREWRFDIDFRLNPHWLRNPETGSIPLPLSLLNDWIRNIQSPLSLESQRSSTSATSFLDNMRSNRAVVLPGNGNRLIRTPDAQIEYVQGSIPPTSRHSQENSNSSQVDELSEFPVVPPSSSRRNSRPTVIDLPDMAIDWSSNPPGPNPMTERHEEPNADAPDRTSPEARTLLSVLERYMPFILILLIKSVLDHGSGLTVFIGLLITFTHANTLLRKEVTKQAKRSIPLLLMIVINLSICTALLYYIFHESRLYPALLCLSTNVNISTFQSLLWVVLVTDFVAKFITVICKSIVIMIPERAIPFQKRGKHYLFIESSSQLYRSVLPIYPWLLYLFQAYEGPLKIFSFLLCLFYIIFKAVDVAQRLKAWKLALKKFLQPVHYGTVPSDEELNDLFCPICHDGFSSPTKLSCGHIFCEDCVSTWLDRGERSCPMCRARVVDDTSWRDGTTSHFIQTF